MYAYTLLPFALIKKTKKSEHNCLGGHKFRSNHIYQRTISSTRGRTGLGFDQLYQAYAIQLPTTVTNASVYDIVGRLVILANDLASASCFKPDHRSPGATQLGRGVGGN